MIALQEKMIEELKAYKQSIITETVTKGLNPNVPMKNSGIDWIGEIPEHWKIVKAKHYVIITNGSDPQTEGDIPVYGSGSTSFKTCGEYKDGPAVLIGRKGATLHIPHYIEGKYWNVDTAFDVKCKENMLLKYYYYLAVSFDYKYYISQTTLPGMAQSSYNNMIIPIPPLSEQRQIASYLDTKCSEIDSLIAIKQQKIAELKEYKKSVIYEYVTGKKEVV
jgi:type I restriction enzyme S subunit